MKVCIENTAMTSEITLSNSTNVNMSETRSQKSTYLLTYAICKIFTSAYTNCCLMVFIIASQKTHTLLINGRKSPKIKKAVVWEKDWQRKSKIRAATLQRVRGSYNNCAI